MAMYTETYTARLLRSEGIICPYSLMVEHPAYTRHCLQIREQSWFESKCGYHWVVRPKALAWIFIQVSTIASDFSVRRNFNMRLSDKRYIKRQSKTCIVPLRVSEGFTGR